MCIHYIETGWVSTILCGFGGDVHEAESFLEYISYFLILKIQWIFKGTFSSPSPRPNRLSSAGPASWSSFAFALLRLLIQILMLFIILPLQATNTELESNLTSHLPWLITWVEMDPDKIWIVLKDIELTNSTLSVVMPKNRSCTSSTSRYKSYVVIPRAFPSPSPYPYLLLSPSLLSPFFFPTLSPLGTPNQDRRDYPSLIRSHLR